MVDFRELMLNKMTHERREEYLFWEKAWKEDEERFKDLSINELIQRFEYYWKNSQFHHDHRVTYTGKDNVYDTKLINLLWPLMLEKLKELCKYDLPPFEQTFDK